MCCNGNQPKVYFVTGNDSDNPKIIQVCDGGDAYNGLMGFAGDFDWENWTTYGGPYQSENEALDNFPDAISIEDQIALSGIIQPSKCPTWLVMGIILTGLIIVLSTHGKVNK
jgi:hypothetical protein